MWLSACQIDLWHDLHNNMCELSLSIPDVCWFLHPLLWSKIGVGFHEFCNFFPWVHYGFMCMVHQIFHAMFESKEIRFYWCIHVATDAHGEILKITASLDSDANESTNPVIEWFSIFFINFTALLQWEV